MYVQILYQQTPGGGGGLPHPDTFQDIKSEKYNRTALLKEIGWYFLLICNYISNFTALQGYK